MATKDGRPKDTTDYSASQAPETQEGVEEFRQDERAIPGGSRRRSTMMVGMESMEKGESVSTDLEQSRYGDSPDAKNPGDKGSTT